MVVGFLGLARANPYEKFTSSDFSITSLIFTTAWNKGKIVSGLFMDVAGAFNNMVHARLLHNLKKRSVDHRAIRWIESFLKTRKTIIKTNEASTKNIEIEVGTPQGSPLSPILYLFYNADLIEVAKKYKCMLSTGFIDDAMFAVAGKSSAANNQILVKAHEEAPKWAKEHGSKFSLKKYQLTHYSWRRNDEHKLDLQLGNQIVKAKLHSKFLGVIMDHKLLWREHVNKLKERATKSITGLTKLAGSTWGGCVLSIRRLYEAIVIPQITYCCSVWYTPPGEEGHKRWMLEDFRNIQARALRVVTGAFRATAKSALDIEAYVLPIKQCLEKLTNDTMLRIVATPSYKSIIGKRSRKQERRRTPLEKLTSRFRKRTGMKPGSIEKLEPFIAPPWWSPPKAVISESKKAGKEQHEALHNSKTDGHVLLYNECI